MKRVLTLSCVSFVLPALFICSGCGWEPGEGTGPRIAAYSDSGCLPGTGDDRNQTFSDLLDVPEDYPGCGEDQLEFAVEGTTLNVVHRNATYNCCPDDIAITLSVEGAVVDITEEEDLTTGGCFCLCCYNVEATAVDLAPGAYTAQFCWDDYETGGEECHTEDIVIP
jgi:hypothetical protein